jgi:hypothetical protein
MHVFGVVAWVICAFYFAGLAVEISVCQVCRTSHFPAKAGSRTISAPIHNPIQIRKFLAADISVFIGTLPVVFATSG